MNENSKKLDHHKYDHSSKTKTGASIFKRCFDKTKISNKKTIQWKKNNKIFMGHKRNLWDENSNLWDENSNLRKDKEKLLGENDDLFDENNQLKDEKDDLLDKNNQLQHDVDKVNKELRKKKEKNKTLKKRNKALHDENENLSKENENLSKQNNYMRNLLSCFGFSFSDDCKQISNNTENQQMFNPFIVPWIKSDEPSLFNGLNKSADNQKQKTKPKTSFSQVQK